MTTRRRDDLVIIGGHKANDNGIGTGGGDGGRNRRCRRTVACRADVDGRSGIDALIADDHADGVLVRAPGECVARWFSSVGDSVVDGVSCALACRVGREQRPPSRSCETGVVTGGGDVSQEQIVDFYARRNRYRDTRGPSAVQAESNVI